ncbi:MAG: CbrC family protein [Lachnospiraceae bacterium]|nr:CbrC family protein [Lachnospiraceae bacterium]
MKAIDLEPLFDYEISLNEQNDVMITVPGYYKGAPEDAVVLYDGGDHAILIRNPQQSILCDSIHPEVKQFVRDSREVLIYEPDTGREYYAVVENSDIGEVTEEAIRLHDYRFRYHPYPQMTQTFDQGEEVCACCKKTVNLFYRGRRLKEDETETIVCPSCIEDMSPLKSDFTLWPYDTRMDKSCQVMEGWGQVIGATPPFLHRGAPVAFWPYHCNELGIFLGKLEAEDVQGVLREELKETWDDEEYSAYLFKCPPCKKHYIYLLKNNEGTVAN